MTLSRLAMVRGAEFPDQSVAGALDKAYFAATTDRDREVLPDPDSPLLATRGWTVDSYTQIATWTEHADRVGAAIAGRIAGGRGAARLIDAGWDAAIGGATWAETRPWLQVLASELVPHRMYHLRDMLICWSEVRATSNPSAGDWTKSVGPDRAALAWAAGLSLREAVEQDTAGTLDPAGLRILATLHGYRLA